MTDYPDAPRLDVVDHLHGRTVPDPYRWVEDPADPRTEQWSAAQDLLTREQLDTLPGRDELDAELTRLLASGSVPVPVWRAGRAFFTRREPGGEHAVLHLREPDGAERALVDVMALDPSGLTTVDSWVPSTEGDRLVYQLSAGGGEGSLLHVLDVATGKALDGPIDRCRYSPVAWLPGGTELFYVRRPAGGRRLGGNRARKMCAALQHATTADAPVLIRREVDAGHAARSVSRTVAVAVDQLAFLAHHTGLGLTAGRRP